MLRSIYDDQHQCPVVEHEIPKEVEEIYVADHGVEPSERHLLIVPKLSKK